jgi:cytidylate kinase
MEESERLSILEVTVATHARKVAHTEWDKEYRDVLSQIIQNAGLSDTIAVDGREIPVEAITKAIREAFLTTRAKELTAKLTDQIVQAAFKKVLDEEQTQ